MLKIGWWGALLMVLGALLAGCTTSFVQATPAAQTVPPAASATTPPTLAPPTFATANSYDRRAMLAHLVDAVILPGHERLRTEAAALEEAVAQLAVDPTAAHLVAAQEQWRETAAAWAAVELFSPRFTMLIHGQIKKWPINTHFIEDALVEEATIDEALIESSGSTARGLGAIEYFLFSQESTDEEIVATLTAEPKRMAYLTALAQNVAHKTDELYTMWSPDGGDQATAFAAADSEASNVQGSISMLANEMIALTETMAKSKLDYPLRGVYAEPQPEAVESPYAAQSLPLIVENLRSMQRTFDAGFADYVDYLMDFPDPSLAQAIDAQIEQTIAAIEAIDAPLRVAVIDDPDAVRAARDEVNALIVLLKADMANQMSITVTFSDNDGD